MPFVEGELPWRIRGYVSRPEFSFRDRNHLYLFVNGRSVRDRLLLAALSAGWQGYFPKGAYPATVLFLDLPADAVDVNVHPTKAEVRFRDPQRIFPWVSRVLREAWAQLRGDLPSVLDLPPKPLEAEFEAAIKPVAATHPHLWHEPAIGASQEQQETLDQRLSTAYSTRPPTGRVAEDEPAQMRVVESLAIAPDISYLGAFDGTYLIAEVRGVAEPELWIIDQHVAHERILFERLFLRSHAPAIQPLMPPQIVHLGPAALARLTPFLEELNRVGVECEHFGEDALVIRGLPDFLIAILGERGQLSDLSEGGDDLQ